jgi:hypothetical protein
MTPVANKFFICVALFASEMIIDMSRNHGDPGFDEKMGEYHAVAAATEPNDERISGREQLVPSGVFLKSVEHGLHTTKMLQVRQWK